MEDQFPSSGKSQAMNIQLAKTLSVLLLILITATPSPAYHLPVHNSNSTNVNATDSDDFHYRFRDDSHQENSTEGYQYGRLSSHISESAQDVQKEDYKNYTVRIVPPLVNHPKTHDKGGNMKVKTGHQMTSGQIETGIVNTHQEEAKELSQHGVMMEINSLAQNEKTEKKQDNGPAIAVYKNEVQKTEPDTLTKLLSLEQRIANYLLQHKHQYLHKSPKDTKNDEKKEAEVKEATTKMGNPVELHGNTKDILPDKNMDSTYTRPRTYDNELQEEITEIVNIQVIPKYNLYDGIGKDDIKTDNVLKDDVAKNDFVKDEVRKENVKNKDKNGALSNSGKEGSVKEDGKVYDYYYDSERRQVVGSTRAHYDYDDKGYVTEDIIDNKEDKHKNKEILKGRQGEKLVHETEILHETGSFHTVENFVEENSHSQKQQEMRWKTKPGSKNMDDNDKEIAVSAFKARVTRGDDENDDKRIDDQKLSLTVDEQFGDNNSGPSIKDTENNKTSDNVDKKVENVIEKNEQLSTGGQLDLISPGNKIDDIKSLFKKDELIDKQLNRNTSTPLGLANARIEQTLPETDNATDKNQMGIPAREDEVKTSAKSGISNESNLPTSHKAMSGLDNLEKANILIKYSTDNDLPIIRDTNLTRRGNITQENLQPQIRDDNGLDSGDLKKADAPSEAYIAGWASTASKNYTDSNMSSNTQVKSSTRLETVTENKDTPVGFNKTMTPVNQGINKTNKDNKTDNSQVKGKISDSYLTKQNKQEITSLKINTNLSNHEIQNTSQISQDNLKRQTNSSNDTNINDHTVKIDQDQTTSNFTSGNSSIHNDNKMVVDVNKLKATREAAGLKLVVSETVERASSSRKVVSQINDYQKVPVQVDPFYDSAAAMTNSNNRKLSTKDTQLETNTTSSMIKALDNSYHYKNNQSATKIQDIKQEISNQVSISVDAKERNNPATLRRELLMKSNSSVEDGKIGESKKEISLSLDDLNSTTDGTPHNLSESGFIRNNATSLQFRPDQAKLQPNSSKEMLKVLQIDDKPPKNQSAGINITAAQTSKFKVESFLATSNQSEARNKQPETETRISEAEKPSPTMVSITKIQAPSIKSTTASNNTLINRKSDGKEDPLQSQKKADVKTKIADKTKVIANLPPLPPKNSVTANENQGNHVNNVKEMKNETFFKNSSNPDFTSLEGNNRNHTEIQQSGGLHIVNYLSNGSNFNVKTQVSNKSVGLNVPRKLLSFIELEIHENKNNKIIPTAQKVENNRSLTGESFKKSNLSVSKLNMANSEVNTTTVKIGKSSSSTGNILKNGTEILNSSHVNPPVKIKNSGVNNADLHGNAINVSSKLEAVPEPSRTEQNISINRKIENTNKTQNSSNVLKNKEKDAVVTITFTVKKNSSNPRIERLAENGTSNSFNKKAGLEPEVMANERHHQQKSQNQKLEPDILLKGELSDRTDLKIDVNSNKDDNSGRINGKEDNEKSLSVSSSSPNSGANAKISDGGDDEEDIGSQQTAGDQRNDNTKDNTKNDNDDRTLRNKGDGDNDPNNNSDVIKKDEQESGTITNKDVVKTQMDETNAMLDQEMGKGISQKNSDLRSDNKLLNVDAKQIQNVENISSNQKTTNMGKDVPQDGDSASSNDVRSPEAGVQSGSLQVEADTKSDDVNDDVHKNDRAGNSSGLSYPTSSGPSEKIPEISPYKIQDFSLLKPSSTKSASSKDKNKTDQLKAKPPPAAASPNNANDNNSSDASSSNSSSVSGYCRDGCSHEIGAGAPQRAQAAVSAVLTTHFGPTKDQMIPFDLELLDLADNYDNTTGMFICTIPGTYVISLYLMSHPGAKVNARVLINNRPIAALWADDAKNAGFYPSSSTQTIAQLAFGDQVYVMLVDGGYGDSWVHANYNVFTIFLLYEQMF